MIKSPIRKCGICCSCREVDESGFYFYTKIIKKEHGYDLVCDWKFFCQDCFESSDREIEFVWED